MNTFTIAILRGFAGAIILAGAAAFTSYQSTDFCDDNVDASGTLVRDLECDRSPWQEVIGATGVAFFGYVGLRGLVEGGVDSRSAAQRSADAKKDGPLG